jgi:arginase family enzyme
MDDLRWHPLTPPSYLDYQHAELLLIATHPSDLPDIAGDEVLHDMEEIADEGDIEHLNKAQGEEMKEEIAGEIFEMLKARDAKGTVVGGDTVITGEWE